MRVFLTGATGFIGTAIIPELLNAGHEILGLTRSEAGAQALLAAGVTPHRGDVEDLASLRSGAETTDAVIHCAFNHDFSKFAQNCQNDLHAIEAIGEVLAGSKRPFLVTSGTAIANGAPGKVATEDDRVPADHPHPRAASELAAEALVERGVNASIVRLSQIHDPVKQGLVTYLIAGAREKGVVAYIGDGSTSWAAAPVRDTAHLYKLALDRAEAGARYHAVAEEGVSMREIAEVIGRGLKLPVVSIPPEQAEAHFGWLAMFARLDLRASSALTRQRTGWNPTGPGLIADLEAMQY